MRFRVCARMCALACVRSHVCMRYDVLACVPVRAHVDLYVTNTHVHDLKTENTIQIMYRNHLLP